MTKYHKKGPIGDCIDNMVDFKNKNPSLEIYIGEN